MSTHLEKLQNWFSQKKVLNDLNKAVFFSEREVWLCHVGVNIGHEQIRTIDTKRLNYKIGKISLSQFSKVKNFFLTIFT